MARKGFLCFRNQPLNGQWRHKVMGKEFVEEGKRWRLLPVQPSAAEIRCRWAMFCGGADRYSTGVKQATEGVFMLPAENG